MAAEVRTKPQKPEHAFASILFKEAARECPWATFEREHVGTYVPLEEHEKVIAAMKRRLFCVVARIIHIGRKGRPDYRVEIDGGRLAFIELKACGDVLSPEQRATLEVLRARKIPCIVLEADNAADMQAEAVRCCDWLRGLR